MAGEGCVPNTVTFNSLITACAQGARCARCRMIALHVGPGDIRRGPAPPTSFVMIWRSSWQCALLDVLVPCSSDHVSPVRLVSGACLGQTGGFLRVPAVQFPSLH